MKELTEAVRALRHGKAVVYPTDTAYGLGVDATNAKAIDWLYQIKGRTFKKPVHIVVSSLAMARRYARLDKRAEKIWEKFMPGALTIVCDLSPSLSPRQGRGAIELLSAGTGTIGVRMPDHEVAISLVKKLHRPITATSANPAGLENPYSIAKVMKLFQNKAYKPDVYIDGGVLPSRKPSTVIRILNNRVTILRQGPISKRHIQKIIRYPSP